MLKDKIIKIEYQFIFSTEDVKIFEIDLDPKTLNIIQKKTRTNYPEWTRADYERCANCTLEKKEHLYCPVAINIYNVVCSFKDLISYDEVVVRVITNEREYRKKLPLMKGVSSLLGIYMATSACPIMSKLKHMVRFHLPFASPLESLNRSLSSYLLAQYFRQKKNKKTDWSLENLKDIYENIRTLNISMRNRLNKTGEGDAHLNALVSLDVFAIQTTEFINEEFINQLEGLFEAYL